MNTNEQMIEALKKCLIMFNAIDKDPIHCVRVMLDAKTAVKEALAIPRRNCDVDSNKIMSESDFEKAFNLHKVSQCCSMCRHGDDEVGSTCTCRHPYRNDNGNYCDPDLPRSVISNTMQNYVCNLFEERIQK